VTWRSCYPAPARSRACDESPSLPPDLQAPGALVAAARRLANGHNELLMMATGPDATSIQMINNSLVSLAGVGLRRHVLIGDWAIVIGQLLC
jgi:hypothetical protein